MKLKVLPIIALVLPFYASATEFGLGASVKESDSSIYFPINLDETMRIEPKLRYFKDTRVRRYDYDRDDYGVRQIEYKQKNLELSVGIFGVQAISENVKTFFGARLGVIKTKYEEDDEGYEDGFDVDGISIEPSFGFEYYFVPQISIGGELGVRYFKSDQEADSFYYDDVDYKSTSTTTSITLRYFF